MEVKINKDIRQYSESIFFGLSMRQFIFSILACLVAVGLYFILRPYFGIETLSWMCILGAAPFAILGFVKYNGMTAEQFLVAWFRSNLKRDFIKNKKEPKTKKIKHKLKNKKKKSVESEVDNDVKDTGSNI